MTSALDEKWIRWLQVASLFFQHHWDAIADRICKSIGSTDEDLLRLRVLQRPFA
jgi:hypothetical protein